MLLFFACCFRKEVEESRREAEKDGIKVPTTLEEYCLATKPLTGPESQSDFDPYDDFDDENDYYVCSTDDDDEVMDDGEEDGNDDTMHCNGTT